MGGREEGVFEKRRESVEVAGGRGEWKVIQRAGGDRNRQRRERQERIKELRYNKWYGKIKEEGVPAYLRKG